MDGTTVGHEGLRVLPSLLSHPSDFSQLAPQDPLHQVIPFRFLEHRLVSGRVQRSGESQALCPPDKVHPVQFFMTA